LALGKSAQLRRGRRGGPAPLLPAQSELAARPDAAVAGVRQRPGPTRRRLLRGARAGAAFDAKSGFSRAAGQPFGPAQPAWSYSDPGTFYSGFISGAQRLPNGDTLICSGAPGRVFEVTPAGHIVWDWRNTLGGEVDPPAQGGKAPPKALFRAWRVPAEDAGGGRRTSSREARRIARD